MELSENIKLVIWDLDDTFWQGAIGENGNITILERNIDIVKLLTDRGIINSIVSKNKFDVVEKKLKEIGMWDYFVLPQISFESKGPIIKKLLETLHLRDTNTLFIDDNKNNLLEAKYYNPNLNVILPIDKGDILNNEHFKGKTDLEHNKLKLYKIIESKYFEELTFDDNLEFLRLSNLIIKICPDYRLKIDRLFELCNKTNLLNYTKRRYDNIKQLKKDLTDPEYKTEYIIAKDKYGYYGIIGFYTINVHANVLIHFVFSCRILGTGIDNFMYNYLGCPYIKIEGAVSNELKKEKIDWILVHDKSVEFSYKDLEIPDITINDVDNKLTCFCIGGCDVSAISSLMKPHINIIERQYPKKYEDIKVNDLSIYNLCNSLLSKDEKDYLYLSLPNEYKVDNYFATSLFNTDADIIVLSLLNSYNNHLYKSGKYPNIVISSYYSVDFKTDFNHILLLNNINIFEDKLTQILNELSKHNHKKIFILNAPDILENDLSCTKELNTTVNYICNKYDNVEVIDINKYVKSFGDIRAFNVKHYNRNVYYNIAKEIIDNINKIS